MDILKYKGYEGTAELDMERGECRGKILFIGDVVTYKTKVIAELQKEFEAAVDDYVETCQALGREAHAPLKGQFNVRVSPALHKAAVLRAVCDGVYLNDVVVRALDAFVNTQVDVNHKHRHDHNISVTVQATGLQTLISSASAPSKWETASYVH